MTIQECYKKMGADYQEVLGRLYNEAMICKFVRMFLQDDSFQILEEALRRGDVKEAFRGAHTLKGVCANLGFEQLINVSRIAYVYPENEIPNHDTVWNGDTAF